MTRPACFGAERPEHPNIILVLIDDLGWADVGCNGSTFYRTPAIDNLARTGMRFTDGYAACPVCSPTRASILTGQYPARLNLTDWLPGRGDMPNQKLLRPKIRQALPLEEITLAEALQNAGYVSASIGKWHLGGAGFSPVDQGFEVNIGGNQSGSPASYFFPFVNKNNPGWQIPQLEQGSPGDYLTDRLTRVAEAFMERNKDRPFFLYLPHYAVHIPLAAKEELMAKYTAQPGSTQTNVVYAAMIESVDASVGRLVDKVRQLGLTDQTIILFTSDNGGLSVREGPFTPATSNSPLRAGKGYLYEGGIRVPWIISWPGQIAQGRVCSLPVSSVDLFPTLLELAGAKTQANRPLDGVSLAPLLLGRGTLKRDAIYWHYPHYSNQGGKPGGAMRSGQLKLIQWYEDGELELYDLAADPSESMNLASRRSKEALSLANKLEAWRRTVRAEMPLPRNGSSPGLTN